MHTTKCPGSMIKFGHVVWSWWSPQNKDQEDHPTWYPPVGGGVTETFLHTVWLSRDRIQCTTSSPQWCNSYPGPANTMPSQYNQTDMWVGNQLACCLISVRVFFHVDRIRVADSGWWVRGWWICLRSHVISYFLFTRSWYVCSFTYQCPLVKSPIAMESSVSQLI